MEMEWRRKAAILNRMVRGGEEMQVGQWLEGGER